MSNLVALPGGTELAGDFRIKRVLGAGGFGITYLADELALGRQVTIKEYFPTDYAARKNDLAAFPRSRESAEDYKWGLDRFIDEAKTLARFDHPNIVRVFRYFRANNTGYMVLQFEEGGSFKNWLRGLGRAPRQTELDTVLGPLLDALELIHKGDFLHRDIAPDNIIVRKDKTPVLIDFGSARGEIASQSRTVSALVKPGYSPYEQYASNTRQQGPWTDIYALGATFYQAISGKRPPDAPSRMVRDEYVPAREAAIGSYRAGFLAAIDKALKLEVTERPQSIAEWRGPLLAPDPKPAAVRPARARIGEVLGLKREDAAEAPAMVAAATEALQPSPPDAPQPPGQLLDFVDGLRKGGGKNDAGKNAAGKAKKAATGRAEPQPAVNVAAAVATAPEAAAHYGLGYGGAPSLVAPRTPARPQPSAEIAVVQALPVQAVQAALPAPAAAAKIAPVATAVERRRPRRRRQLWAVFRNPWRGLILKFAAGVAVATVFTLNQDRWPLNLLSLPSPPARHAAAPRPVALVPKAEAIAPKVELPAQRNESGRDSGAGRDGAGRDSGRDAGSVLQLASQQLTSAPGTVTAARFAGDTRRLITASTDATLKIWDTESGGLLRRILLPEGAATALAVQDSLALTGHVDGTLALWDIEKGERLAVFRRNTEALTAVVFAPEAGHYIAASKGGGLAVWDRKSPTTPVQVSERPGAEVKALVRVPARDAIAYAVADQIRLTNSEDLSDIRNYSSRAAQVALFDSPDNGRALASASSDGHIRIWSTRSSRLIKTIETRSGETRAMSYAPSGDMLASVGLDGVLKLWDAKRGRLLASSPTPLPATSIIAVAQDGRHIATVDSSGAVKLWDTGGLKLARD